MKKAIALLLALALVGGVVFAEDAAATGPVVTIGAKGAYGFNVVEMTDGVDNAKFETEAVGLNTTQNTKFQIEPWAKFVWGNLAMTAKTGFMVYDDRQGTDEAARLFQLSTVYTNNGLTLSDTITLDQGNYRDTYWGGTTGFFHDMGMKLVKDKVTTELVWRNKTAPVPADGILGYAYNTLNGSELRQAYFQINDMFDVWTLKAGDRLNQKYLRMMSIGDQVFTSNSVIGRFRNTFSVTAAQFDAAVAGNIDLFSTIALGKKWEALPLTLYIGHVSPIAATTIRDWLYGANQFYGAKFALEGIATFDAGFAPRMNYALNQDYTFTPFGAGAVTMYTNGSKVSDAWMTGFIDFIEADPAAAGYEDLALAMMTPINGSSLWFDANIGLEALPALSAQIGFDLQMMKYVSVKKLVEDMTAGKGIITDPLVYEMLNTSVMNIGLEAAYDLGDIVSGLDLFLGAYLTSAGAYDFEKATGSKFTAPTASGTVYVAPNYNEKNSVANGVFGINPLYLQFKVGYALNDTFAFSFETGYTSLAGDLEALSGLTAGKDVYGFYDETNLSLGVDITAGQGTIGISVGYNLFNLPKAASLYADGATEAQKKALDVNYATILSSDFNPWSLDVTYSVSF